MTQFSVYDQLGIEDDRPPEETPYIESAADKAEKERQEKLAAQQDIAFQIDEVQETAKNSLDFLAGLATPDTYKYAFPPVYLSVWQWLLTYIHKVRDFSQRA